MAGARKLPRDKVDFPLEPPWEVKVRWFQDGDFDRARIKIGGNYFFEASRSEQCLAVQIVYLERLLREKDKIIRKLEAQLAKLQPKVV